MYQLNPRSKLCCVAEFFLPSPPPNISTQIVLFSIFYISMYQFSVPQIEYLLGAVSKKVVMFTSCLIFAIVLLL